MNKQWYARQRCDSVMRVCRFNSKRQRDEFVKAGKHRWAISALMALKFNGSTVDYGNEALPITGHVTEAKTQAVFVAWRCPYCDALNKNSYVSRNPVGETARKYCVGCHKSVFVLFK